VMDINKLLEQFILKNIVVTTDMDSMISYKIDTSNKKVHIHIEPSRPQRAGFSTPKHIMRGDTLNIGIDYNID
jgi:hypothetical protein